jgi:peptide/nickel transport system substrate-binding protein
MGERDQNTGLDALLSAYAGRQLGRRAFVKRAAALGLSVPAATALLAAQAPHAASAQDAEPQPGGRFTWGYDRDFTKMDPVSSGWADPGYNALYDYTMVRHPETGLPVPMLAESWEIAEDGTTWRLNIREGITFQSGAPATAEVVVENFNVFRDPEQGQNAIFWATVTDVTSEDNTVVVTASQPFAAFPETLATEYSMIYNPVAREEAGEQYGATSADGTGPFTLTEFTPGNQVLVTRWDDYPGANVEFVSNPGPAYLDEIRWVPILESGNRAIEIEAGNVDAVNNPGGQDVDRLKGNPDLVVMEWPNPANFFLSLDHQNTELGFDDLRVRQAISHAIDREGIAQAVYFGHAVATYGPIAANWKWYEPGVEEFNQYDPDLARTLLDEAGWTEGADGIREKDGVRLSWNNANFGAQPFNRPIIEIITENLREIGAEMTSDHLELAAFVEARNANPPSFSMEWLWSSPLDVLIIFGKVIPSSAYNGDNPDLLAAFDAWQSAANDEELQVAASDAQLIWAEQLTKIPVVTSNAVWVNRTSVHGFLPSQTMLYPLLTDIWVEQ